MNDTERALDRAHDALHEARRLAARDHLVAHLAPTIGEVYLATARLMTLMRDARLAAQPQAITGMANHGGRVVVTGWAVTGAMLQHFHRQLADGRVPFSRYDLARQVEVASSGLSLVSASDTKRWLDSLGPIPEGSHRVLLVPVMLNTGPDTVADVQNVLDEHRERTGDTVVVFTEPHVLGGLADWTYWPEVVVIARRDEVSTGLFRLTLGRPPRLTHAVIPETVRIAHDGTLVPS